MLQGWYSLLYVIERDQSRNSLVHSGGEDLECGTDHSLNFMDRSKCCVWIFCISL